ncbi:hypothetical protein [Desnuesiella massiliensis]|uniref:hypothetical protein n=1 Tax=Desnuesiella massiliensis TaxID=1650662 RepID=UPI0006E42506|nr:hypothetical protein [Desnuesiella massiliensis]
MFMGNNIKRSNCNELIEGLDLFNILLKGVSIEVDNSRDAKLPRYFRGHKEEYTDLCNSYLKVYFNI